MSIVLIDDEGALVIWQGGALEVWGPPDLEPHEPWALWLVVDGTQGATRRLMRGSEADIKRLRGYLIDELIALGKRPHIVLDLPRLMRFGREETTT
jgi:hypothetical protein